MLQKPTLLGVSLFFSLFCLHAPLARAAVISVNATCSLPNAIIAANTDSAVGGCSAGSGADSITLPADVVLTVVNNSD